MHSNASNPFRVVQICIRILSNGSNLHSNANDTINGELCLCKNFPDFNNKCKHYQCKEIQHRSSTTNYSRTSPQWTDHNTCPKVSLFQNMYLYKVRTWSSALRCPYIGGVLISEVSKGFYCSCLDVRLSAVQLRLS